MFTTGLEGPFPLAISSIDSEVTSVSPATYALGCTQDDRFWIMYVGRADADLRARLHAHVGSYSEFKFAYYPSAKEAFEKECQLFHTFEPPGNKSHPVGPDDSMWKCPRCAALG
jgi:hypothetical protein